MPENLMPAAYLAGGLILLYLGGELLVRGAVGLAKGLGVSNLFIGLVVVAFGTSSPELFVAVEAVVNKTPDIAVGNVIGSNIANVMLVLALAALLYPVTCTGRVVYRDGVALMAATGLLIWFATARGAVDHAGGLVLVGGLAVYLVFSYITERDKHVHGDVATTQMSFLMRFREHQGALNLLWTVVGVGALVGGAHLVISSAVDIARMLDVSEGVISITMVAVGTSLPELAAVGVAAAKRQTAIVVGGILGSNIFNILAVLGIAALVKPVTISTEFLGRDLWVMLGAAIILLLVNMTRWRFGRVEGLVLLVAYGLYVYVLYFNGLPGMASG